MRSPIWRNFQFQRPDYTPYGIGLVLVHSHRLIFILLYYENRTSCTHRGKKKQTNKQTNTNLRHTQCVNNEIHIGGRQDRHISKLTLDKQKVINYANYLLINLYYKRNHRLHQIKLCCRKSVESDNTTTICCVVTVSCDCIYMYGGWHLWVTALIQLRTQ